MDAPIASRIAEWFCEGYEKRAKVEENEAEELVNAISFDALKALCTRYDNKTGEYPGHEHEGAAVLVFFEKMKDDVEGMVKKKDEK